MQIYNYQNRFTYIYNIYNINFFYLLYLFTIVESIDFTMITILFAIKNDS